MAPVRHDSPHRPGHILNGVAPGAPTPQPNQAAGGSARPASAPAIRDGFESANARSPRAAAGAPRDTFEAASKTPAARAPGQPALGPKQQKAYQSLAPDQRARFDQLAGAAQADPTNKGKALKQVQSL